LKKTNELLKNQLDKELGPIQFSRHQEVLSSVYPKTWKQKFRRLWNKEITIPLLPVSAAFVLFIVMIGYVEIRPTDPSITSNQERVLIDVAGNYYWKDDFERELKKHEN
jgi:hypothetical protein